MTYMNSFSDEFEKIAMSPAGQALNMRANAASSLKRYGKSLGAGKSEYFRKAKGKAGNFVKDQAEDAAVIRKSTPVQTRIAQKFGLMKNAGEMQGYTRIGRKPISIEKMLSNESEVTGLPEDFAPAIEKAAGAMVKMARTRDLALLGSGAVAALLARQAKEDHKLGRMIRKQQQQGQ